MPLTIATTHQPATDLGYLLHKHPARTHLWANRSPFVDRCFHNIQHSTFTSLCYTGAVIRVSAIEFVPKPMDFTSGPIAYNVFPIDV